MENRFTVNVKNDDELRASFNQLTMQTFGFDFRDWYAAGHWGDLYIPHVLTDQGKVVSNVSVNRMQFDLAGQMKNFIQLGTVMTDAAYRGRGMNRRIMEGILAEYDGKTDGFYLFGNDSVLDYYPRFGFVPVKEYEYYISCESSGTKVGQNGGYRLEKQDMEREESSSRFYEKLRQYTVDPAEKNENDAMYMNENIGLYQFWMAAGYKDQVYYLPETDNYVMAEEEDDRLRIHQVFGKSYVDICRLAGSFGKPFQEVVLGYTPVHKEQFSVREYREEDCTLFVLGEALKVLETDRMRFPVLSHA